MPQHRAFWMSNQGSLSCIGLAVPSALSGAARQRLVFTLYLHVQSSTLLGPAFALGVIPDAMSAPRPSVFDTCLQGLSRKSPQEMHRTQETLRTVMHTIYSMLHTLSMSFLKSQVRSAAHCSSVAQAVSQVAQGP